MQIGLNHRVAISPDILVEDMDGELALLHLQTEDYFTLNKTGARMVDLLADVEGSVQAAYERLQAQYDVEPERLQQELLDYYGALVDRGILTVQT